MSTLTRKLVADASKYLGDETNVQWLESDLVNFLNYAESAICIMKPDAYSDTATRQLDPGLLQDKADAATEVGALIMNMGSDGLTPGIAITPMPLNVMNMNTSWTQETAATEIKHFIRIPGDKMHFFVWPPVHASTAVYVMESYPASPTTLVETDFDTGTETINLPDTYINPLLDLMLFRACDMLKTKAPEMAQKGAAALARAMQTVTGKTSTEGQQISQDRAR